MSKRARKAEDGWTEIERRPVPGAIFISPGWHPPQTFEYYCGLYRVSEWKGDRHRERLEFGPAIYRDHVSGSSAEDVADADLFQIAKVSVHRLLKHEQAVVGRQADQAKRGTTA